MKETVRVKRICPKCNKEYTDYPAISRADNKTMICPDCGILEALASIGINEEERAKILDIVNKHSIKQ